MLALFKPWRSLVDLKASYLTFPEAFLALIETASLQILKAMDNIQYFYECSNKAWQNCINKTFRTAWSEASESHDEEVESDNDNEESSISQPPHIDTPLPEVTEEDIENAMQNSHCTHELLYADVAINITEDFAIFDEVPVAIAPHQPSHVASDQQIQMYMEWQGAVEYTETAKKLSEAKQP
ncbi:hypothetical protein EDB19DRAFT_1913856 [Suillus lakei]|nr:hypothetical protein EDB19DRAFT_1913856 [Suillus lakei]